MPFSRRKMFKTFWLCLTYIQPFEMFDLFSIWLGFGRIKFFLASQKCLKFRHVIRHIFFINITRANFDGNRINHTTWIIVQERVSLQQRFVIVRYRYKLNSSLCSPSRARFEWDYYSINNYSSKKKKNYSIFIYFSFDYSRSFSFVVLICYLLCHRIVCIDIGVFRI